MPSTSTRARDHLGGFAAAWKLGAFVLLLVSIGSLGAALPVAFVLLLLGMAAEAVVGPLPWAQALLGPLVAVVAVPFGAGIVAPALRGAIAEYQARMSVRPSPYV